MTLRTIGLFCLCVFLILQGIIYLFGLAQPWTPFVLGATSLTAGVLLLISSSREGRL